MATVGVIQGEKKTNFIIPLPGNGFRRNTASTSPITIVGTRVPIVKISVFNKAS